MAMKRDISAMQKVVDEAGRCELCGSRRGLEAHHIIPISAGGDNSEENLICVCSTCHARLTPRSKLRKMGLDKVKTRNYLVALWIEIYDRCENAESIIDIFDAVDRTMASAIEKVG